MHEGLGTRVRRAAAPVVLARGELFDGSRSFGGGGASRRNGGGGSRGF